MLQIFFKKIHFYKQIWHTINRAALGSDCNPYHTTHCLSAVVVNMITGTNVAILPGELIFTNALC